MLKHYLALVKPGIIIGNVITAICGFFLASRGGIDGKTGLFLSVGIALVIASACIVNNLHDVAIDSKMERTKKRPLVNGAISARSAILWAVGFSGCGFLLLWTQTTPVAAIYSGLAFVIYTAIYTPLKLHTHHATLIGAVAGALPPVVGYTAVDPSFTLECGILFLLILFWQMPHFGAIAIYRRSDYLAASIPVTSIKKGLAWAVGEIKLYTLFYGAAVVALGWVSKLGFFYWTIMLILGAVWHYIAFVESSCLAVEIWAKKMFRFSLVVVLGLLPAILFG